MLFNFGINGLLILVIYVYFSENIRRPIPQLRFDFGFDFFFIVLAISLTGGIVDGLVFMADYLPAYIIGAILIAIIVGMFAYRYLGFPTEWSLSAALTFFFVNILGWMLLRASDLLVEDLWFVFVILGLVFLFTLSMVSKKFHARGTSVSADNDKTEWGATTELLAINGVLFVLNILFPFFIFS